MWVTTRHTNFKRNKVHLTVDDTISNSMRAVCGSTLLVSKFPGAEGNTPRCKKCIKWATTRGYSVA